MWVIQRGGTGLRAPGTTEGKWGNVFVCCYNIFGNPLVGASFYNGCDYIQNNPSNAEMNAQIDSLVAQSWHPMTLDDLRSTAGV